MTEWLEVDSASVYSESPLYTHPPEDRWRITVGGKETTGVIQASATQGWARRWVETEGSDPTTEIIQGDVRIFWGGP